MAFPAANHRLGLAVTRGARVRPFFVQTTLTSALCRFATYSVEPVAFSSSIQGSAPVAALSVTGFELERMPVKLIFTAALVAALATQAQAPLGAITAGG
jgi:hypothetical protein